MLSDKENSKGKQQTMLWVYLAPLLVILSACSNVAVLPSLEEPEEQLTFYACDWQPQEPTAERLVVDLVLFTNNQGAVPEEEAIKIIRQADGLLVHRFRTNLIRVEIDKIKIPNLVSNRIVETAFLVSDQDSLNARLDVLYQYIIGASDVEAITDLGATLVGEPIDSRISALAPDKVIPQIKSLPGVSLVRAKSIGCATPH